MARVAATLASSTEHYLLAATRKVMDAIWSEAELGRGHNALPLRIGVCVSGGPDSMALAYLLKQFSDAPTPDSRRTKPLAFIVDHNARKDSAEEAEKVQRELENFDIETKILRLHWPSISDPGSLPDFELRARRGRYRLIADACIQRQARVDHLFLGHHQDDQVETVLMRLIRNSGDSFLGRQGMPAHSTIPCCEDLRRAHFAEEYRRFETWLRGIIGEQGRPVVDPLDINEGKTVTISKLDRIQIHRPLLAFRKSELTDFCDFHRITYVVDRTNFDPTLTLRNAVRHLRLKHELPKALQAPSVLDLQKQSQNMTEALSTRADAVARAITLSAFDLRSGRVTINIAPRFESLAKEDPEAAAHVLARLAAIASPQAKDDEPSLVPRSNLAEFLRKTRQREPQSMTMQQVLLEKAGVLPQGCNPFSTTDHQVSIDFQTKGMDIAIESRCSWTLSRPPMRKREIEAATAAFLPTCRWTYGGKPNRWRYLPFETNHGSWSQWLLWDHRYWIRVRVKSLQWLKKIGIRPYAETDASEVHDLLEDQASEFQKMLHEAAPGKARYTIPVLTVKDKISVFPTLNVQVQQPNHKYPRAHLDHHRILEWEVCYKAFDNIFLGNAPSKIDWKNAQVKHERK